LPLRWSVEMNCHVDTWSDSSDKKKVCVCERERENGYEIARKNVQNLILSTKTRKKNIPDTTSPWEP